jgi:hypothetical protein
MTGMGDACLAVEARSSDIQGGGDVYIEDLPKYTYIDAHLSTWRARA